MGQNKIPPAHI